MVNTVSRSFKLPLFARCSTSSEVLSLEDSISWRKLPTKISSRPDRTIDTRYLLLTSFNNVDFLLRHSISNLADGGLFFCRVNGNDIRGISGIEKQLAYSAPLDAVNSICAGIALVVVYQYLVDLSLEIHWKFIGTRLRFPHCCNRAVWSTRKACYRSILAR